MAKNSKFYFREENLGNDEDALVSVPDDLQWAVNEGIPKPLNPGSGTASGSGLSSGSGGQTAEAPYQYGDTRPYPSTKIDTPVIRGIAKQEVSQDPEGKGSIDVTFAVDDIGQTSVEWEVRITR